MQRSGRSMQVSLVLLVHFWWHFLTCEFRSEPYFVQTNLFMEHISFYQVLNLEKICAHVKWVKLSSVLGTYSNEYCIIKDNFLLYANL